MSALRRRHQRRPGSIELTPLVDVALILVVFFLLSAGMVAPDEQMMEIALPVTSSGEAAFSRLLHLSLTAEGALYHQQRSITLDHLPELVEAGQTVVLRADRHCPHGRVIEVIDVLRQQRVGSIFHASQRGAEAW